MSYLALNKTQLSRFSHHWFWGLRVDTPGDKTCFDLAMELQSDPSQPVAIVHQMQAMAQSFKIIQAVY